LDLSLTRDDCLRSPMSSVLKRERLRGGGLFTSSVADETTAEVVGSCGRGSAVGLSSVRAVLTIVTGVLSEPLRRGPTADTTSVRITLQRCCVCMEVCIRKRVRGLSDRESVLERSDPIDGQKQARQGFPREGIDVVRARGDSSIFLGSYFYWRDGRTDRQTDRQTAWR
jgi:hypothetical protein